MKKEDVSKILSQEEERKISQANGSGAWTIVYDSWCEDGVNNGGRFAAFASPSYRERAKQSAAWDLHKGGGFPGFSQHNDGDEWVTTYCRNSAGPDIEPLIIVQEMHGVVEDAYLVAEEFRLLLNLWEDKASGDFYSFTDDGSRELAVEFKGSQIRVRTPLLRRYQAARQLDLLLFTDSNAFVSTDIPVSEFSYLDELDHVEDDSVVFLGVGNMRLSGNMTFSRLLVKRILHPPSQEKCGMWPWDSAEEEYPEFIIDEDSDGQLVKFTCDPDTLANYFGANPDAPHYLTPVFFRPEVLKRYYGDPSLYSVSDGRLSCGSLWGVQINNGSPEAVMVFLGDIGRDIPNGHRDHWRAYNIPPVSSMSESTFRRSFLAQFSETENPEHQFKNAYLGLQESWKENWGWGLYRDATGSDVGLIHRLHIPLDDTDVEFEGQLLSLAKLLVDLLNESKLVAGLPAIANEKGISKLRRFLEVNEYEFTDRDIALLRRIQNLRSRIAAHTSGSGGEAYLAMELGVLSKPAFIEKLMRDSVEMFASLSEIPPR